MRHSAGDPARHSAGRWITLGARAGDDGKRHGGTPVYVEDGRITRGAPSLTGKRIAALDEAGETGGHRRELNQSKAYSRAVWAKKARAEGIDPKHLHQLAGEMFAHSKAHAEGVTKVLQSARSAARSLGTDLTTIKARAARGIDAAAVRHLDDIAMSVQAEYPEYFSGEEGAEGELLDRVRSLPCHDYAASVAVEQPS